MYKYGILPGEPIKLSWVYGALSELRLPKQAMLHL